MFDWLIQLFAPKKQVLIRKKEKSYKVKNLNDSKETYTYIPRKRIIVEPFPKLQK